MPEVRQHPRPCRLVVALVLAATLLAQPLAAAGKIETGAATPEALVARMEKSYASGDIIETMACLHPDDRAEMALGLTLGVGMMVAFMGMGGELAAGMAEGMAEGMSGEQLDAKEKAKIEAGQKEMAKKSEAAQRKYDAILVKYGLDEKMKGEGPALGEDPQAAAKALQGVDTLGLSAELFGLMKELGEDKKIEKGGPLASSNGKLDGLEVDGDRGTVRAGTETIEILKADGRWYFKAPDKRSP